MERFPYQGDRNVIFFVLILLAIVLAGNFILHIRGVMQGFTLAMRDQSEGKDPAIQRAAIMSLLQDIAGAIVSVFLFSRLVTVLS